MRTNLETIGIMGKGTVRLGVDTLSVIAGSLVFPSYCRTQCDKIGDDLGYDEKENIVTMNGKYVPEANRSKSKSDFALVLGVIASASSFVGVSGFVDNSHIFSESVAYCSSLILGTNVASGLYEWFRATKYPGQN